MVKGKVIYIHNVHKKEQNYVICKKIDETGGHLLSEVSQAQNNKYCMFPLMWKLDFKNMQIEGNHLGRGGRPLGRRDGCKG
jgi:hypothetical protein